MITWLGYCLSGFSTVKLLPFPHIQLPSLETSHSAQPTLEGGIKLHLLEGKCLHKPFINLPYRRSVSFPFIYLFNNVYQYGLMAVYFIIWIIILHYVILLLKLFQLWHLDTLSGWLLCPFTQPHHCVF